MENSDYDSDYYSDSEIPDKYKARLETLTYKQKQEYLESVVDVAILFAYEELKDTEEYQQIVLENKYNGKEKKEGRVD